MPELNLPTPEAFFVTLAVVSARVILEGAPTMLAGVAIAAWLRLIAKPETVAAWFAGEGWTGTLKAMAIGCCMPLCALGVLPVLAELEGFGVSLRRRLVLWLTVPLLNPLTLLYGLSILPTTQFLLIVLATCLVALVVAEVAARFMAGTMSPIRPEPPRMRHGSTRIVNLLITAASIAVTWLPLQIGLAIALTTATAALLPASSLEPLVALNNPWGPLSVPLLVGPQYVSPMSGVLALSAIQSANLSVASGMVLYLFGVGVSGVTLIHLLRGIGLARTMALGIALSAVIVAGSYGSSVLLPAPVGMAEETHGLDPLTRPALARFDQLPLLLGNLWKYLDPLMRAAAITLPLLIAGGVMIRRRGWEVREDPPPTPEELESAAAGLNRQMSSATLGICGMVGVAIISGLGLYIVFPPPSEALEQMRSIQADAAIAINTNNARLADERLRQWDQVAAKLPVGWGIRGRLPTSEQAEAIRELRLALGKSRQLLAEGAGDTALAKQNSLELMRRHRACLDICGESNDG